MRNLFLASSFQDVASRLARFTKESPAGKRVAFIPTASQPELIKFYVGLGRKALEKLGLQVDVLEITKASAKEISEKLRNSDFIYVSGGNTFFLLQELRRSGADKIILEQINAGKMYIGESAGSMILSPNIAYVQDMDESRKAKDLETFAALNVVDFYPLPHYKNFPFKRKVEKIILKYESKLDLIPFSNSQVILVEGDDMRIENS